MDDVQRVYETLFKKKIPQAVRDRFCEASSRFSAGFSSDDKKQYDHIIDTVSDLEALELAARYRNRLPYLIHQFQLMVRLAETIPENRHEFINSKDRRLTGVFYVLLSGIRTFIKLIKGFYLLRKRNV